MSYLKNSLVLMTLVILMATFTTACRRSSDPNPSGPNVITPATGAWKVTYFFDRKDETGNFANYLFEFQNDGTLLASQPGNTYRGTWRSFSDSGVQKFLMDFPGTVHPGVLDELEDDWRIIQMDVPLMHLDHISGGDGHTSIIKFEKF